MILNKRTIAITQQVIDVATITERLAETSAAGIAGALLDLINSGEARVGSRLPRVRDVAANLHVSAATVSAAWKILRDRGLIEGNGRQGSWVASSSPKSGPQRFELITQHWPAETLDLTYAAPDSNFLPQLQKAFQFSVSVDDKLNSYHRQDVTPFFRESLNGYMPFSANSFLAVSGGYEGLNLTLKSLLSPGQRIAIPDYVSPRTLDIIESCGLRAVPVETDTNGPLASALSQQLNSGAVAFAYEPRASATVGVSVSYERIERLSEVLRNNDSLIIEDDGAGAISNNPWVTLGKVCPERTVVIHSFSKAYGPDMRMAIIGSGNSDLVGRIRGTLKYGAGWVSRILQNAMAYLLTDSDAQCSVCEAREEYRRRRHLLRQILLRQGIEPIADDALVLSVPVVSGYGAQIVTAAHGYAVLSSAHTRVVNTTQPYIRATVGALKDEKIEHFGKALALAAKSLDPNEY